MNPRTLTVVNRPGLRIKVLEVGHEIHLVTEAVEMPGRMGAATRSMDPHTVSCLIARLLHTWCKTLHLKVKLGLIVQT